jgi:tetratricopeptide (TPR) repeat protein
LELLPDNAEAYAWLAHFCIAVGDYTNGIQAINDARKVWDKQEMIALLGVAYARMGEPERAREVLRQLEEMKRSREVQPYFVARVYMALGEKDRALDYLEKAERDRSEYLVNANFAGLRTDPIWDELQDEPRYWAICDAVGLGKDEWPRPFDP